MNYFFCAINKQIKNCYQYISHKALLFTYSFSCHCYLWDLLQAEEAETAAVLNEYIADFQTGAAGGKTFVRAGIINPNKSEGKLSLNH